MEKKEDDERYILDPFGRHEQRDKETDALSQHKKSK